MASPSVILRAETELLLKVGGIIFHFEVMASGENPEALLVVVASPALPKPLSFGASDPQHSRQYVAEFLSNLVGGQVGVSDAGGLDLRIVDIRSDTDAKKLYAQEQRRKARELLETPEDV